jgi:hypothetical protein
MVSLDSEFEEVRVSSYLVGLGPLALGEQLVC